MIGTGMQVSVGVLCISTPPEVVREASVMTKNGLAVSGILITGADRNTSLSLTKASSWSFPQLKGMLFLVRSMSGQTIAEKWGMNFR